MVKVYGLVALVAALLCAGATQASHFCGVQQVVVAQPVIVSQVVTPFIPVQQVIVAQPVVVTPLIVSPVVVQQVVVQKQVQRRGGYLGRLLGGYGR